MWLFTCFMEIKIWIFWRISFSFTHHQNVYHIYIHWGWHNSDVKSPTDRLFVQQVVQVNNNEIPKLRFTGPVWGVICDWWPLFQRPGNVERIYTSWRHDKLSSDITAPPPDYLFKLLFPPPPPPHTHTHSPDVITNDLLTYPPCCPVIHFVHKNAKMHVKQKIAETTHARDSSTCLLIKLIPPPPP